MQRVRCLFFLEQFPPARSRETPRVNSPHACTDKSASNGWNDLLIYLDFLCIQPKINFVTVEHLQQLHHSVHVARSKMTPSQRGDRKSKLATVHAPEEAGCETMIPTDVSARKSQSNEKFCEP